MQLGIHRHGDQTRVPDGKQHLEIDRTIAHRENNAISMAQTLQGPQAAGQLDGSGVELGVAELELVADRDGRAVAVRARGVAKQGGNVHGSHF